MQQELLSSIFPTSSSRLCGFSQGNQNQIVPMLWSVGRRACSVLDQCSPYRKEVRTRVRSCERFGSTRRQNPTVQRFPLFDLLPTTRDAAA
jgi:hypothetical protein